MGFAALEALLYGRQARCYHGPNAPAQAVCAGT